MMKACTTYTVSIFILSFLFESHSHAQTIGGANAYLFRPVGIRAIGLGGSLVSDATDPSALFWNPSGLGAMSNIQFTSSVSILPFDQYHNFVAVAVPIARGFTIGGGWLNYTIGRLDKRDEYATPLGEFTSADNAFLLGFGVSFPLSSASSSIQIGFTGKYLSSVIDHETASGIGLDGGVRFVYNQFSFGASLQNVGTSLKWDTESKRNDKVPIAFRTGVSQEFFTKQVGTTYSTRVIFEGAKFGDNSFGWIGGIELKMIIANPKTSIALRSGYGRDLWTGGISFEFNLDRSTAVGFDYAASQDYLSTSMLHNIGLHLIF